MAFIFPPLTPGCVYFKPRSIRMFVPVSNVLSMQGVIRPNCAIIGFVHTKPDLFKIVALLNLPTDGNPH